MSDLPATRPSLLVRLRDARDGQAWTQFVQVYGPLVYHFARKRGLQDADAADLTQDVLRAVAGAAGRLKYDPARGSFRSWLFRVVRNRLRDFLTSCQRRLQGTGDSAAQQFLQEQPVPEDDVEALWQREYERRLFIWAVEQVRGDFQEVTWRAFQLTAIEGKSGKEAAQTLGLSVAAVYLAKSRILARLKEQIRHLQGE